MIPVRCGSNAVRNAVLALALALNALPLAAQGVDEDAAVALARKGNCFRCHAVDKAKKAPAYAKVAQKYKGNPDAEELLYKHITGNPVVKLDDGDEKHEAPPSKDDSELRNLIRWILSR